MAVYFLQSGEDGPVKIGYTAGDAWSRLRGLQTGNPEELRVLAVVDGTLADERALHERFKALNVRGEWFRPDALLLGFIAGLIWTRPKNTKLDDPPKRSILGLDLDQFHAIVSAVTAWQTSTRATEIVNRCGGVDYADAGLLAENKSILPDAAVAELLAVRYQIELLIWRVSHSSTAYDVGIEGIPGGLTGLHVDLDQIEAVLQSHRDAGGRLPTPEELPE